MAAAGKIVRGIELGEEGKGRGSTKKKPRLLADGMRTFRKARKVRQP
jgi:hypothetical protein